MSNPLSKHIAWVRGIQSRHSLKRRLLFGIYGCHLIEKTETPTNNWPRISGPLPTVETDKTSTDS